MFGNTLIDNSPKLKLVDTLNEIIDESKDSSNKKTPQKKRRYKK